MATDLVTQADIESVLLRPLTSPEAIAVNGPRGLIVQLESQLRFVRPVIDEWIAEWTQVPRPATALDPIVVASMLAAVIKRTLTNPRGLWSTSETDGDYSYSETYPGQRAGATAGTPGDLEITTDDLAKLRATSPRGRSIRTSRLPYTQVPRRCSR